MSALILSIVILSSFFGLFALPIVIISIATWLILPENNLNFIHETLVVLTLSLIPLAAYLSSRLIESWTGANDPTHSWLSRISSVAAMFFILSKVGLEPMIGAVTSLPATIETKQALAWISVAGSSALFCTFLSASVVMLVGILLEFPFHVFTRASKSHLNLPYAALRQCIALLCVVATLDLMGGLLSRELSGATLIHRIFN